MDLLTLIALAAHDPAANLVDMDGDHWHAACVLRYMGGDPNSGLGSNLLLASLRIAESPLHERCFTGYCQHPWRT